MKGKSSPYFDVVIVHMPYNQTDVKNTTSITTNKFLFAFVSKYGMSKMLSQLCLRSLRLTTDTKYYKDCIQQFHDRLKGNTNECI